MMYSVSKEFNLIYQFLNIILQLFFTSYWVIQQNKIQKVWIKTFTYISLSIYIMITNFNCNKIHNFGWPTSFAATNR